MSRSYHRPIRILRTSTNTSAPTNSINERNHALSLRQWLSLYTKQQSRRPPAQQKQEDVNANGPPQPSEEEIDHYDHLDDHRLDNNTQNANATIAAVATTAVHPVEQTLSLPQNGPLARLVELIWKFCTNPAVNDSGRWTMNIPIDPTLLPGATLSMSVSYFELSLRFTTTDPTTKKLICLYNHALQQRLTQLVPTRRVDILVF